MRSGFLIEKRFLLRLCRQIAIVPQFVIVMASLNSATFHISFPTCLITTSSRFPHLSSLPAAFLRGRISVQSRHKGLVPPTCLSFATTRLESRSRLTRVSGHKYPALVRTSMPCRRGSDTALPLPRSRPGEDSIGP
jgi:hypothetical protein